MRRLRHWLLGSCGALHLLALACWLAAIVATGVAATAVFTMLPKVGVVVPAFSAYVEASSEHRAGGRTGTQDGVSSAELAREHGRIAGGMVMDPVFRWSDRVQAGLAMVAALTLMASRFPGSGAQCRGCGLHRSTPNVLRLVCILAAGTLLAWQLGVLGPRMETALHGWWAAAKGGDFPRADALRGEFDADHVVANRLYNVRLLLVLAALAAAGFVAGAAAAKPSDPCPPAPDGLTR